MGTYTLESLRTVRPRLDTLTRSFGRRPVDQLSHKAIERWLEGLEHLSPNSRASYLASVRKFTAWLARERIIRVDPCLDIPKAKRTRSVPRAQSKDAVCRLLAACKDERELAVVWLMLDLGLRRAEVAGLRWEDYDERDRTMLIRLGKGGRERLLPVPDACAAALERLPRRMGAIIQSEHDWGPVKPATIGVWMTALFRRAGLKRAPYDGQSGHAIRHTAGSDVLDASGDLRVAQMFLGHEALSSTSIYLRRASAGQIRSAVEAASAGHRS